MYLELKLNNKFVVCSRKKNKFDISSKNFMIIKQYTYLVLFVRKFIKIVLLANERQFYPDLKLTSKILSSLIFHIVLLVTIKKKRNLKNIYTETQSLQPFTEQNILQYKHNIQQLIHLNILTIIICITISTQGT